MGSVGCVSVESNVRINAFQDQQFGQLFDERACSSVRWLIGAALSSMSGAPECIIANTRYNSEVYG